ncbi:unannotated protein [freshwater metagenome]|uniref:Unannotated protein n=1 Tax=freshwater metagenome TaxID=449393 RepID=A0A6J6ZLK1_9ZZZZ
MAVSRAGSTTVAAVLAFTVVGAVDDESVAGTPVLSTLSVTAGLTAPVWSMLVEPLLVEPLLPQAVSINTAVVATISSELRVAKWRCMVLTPSTRR